MAVEQSSRRAFGGKQQLRPGRGGRVSLTESITVVLTRYAVSRLSDRVDRALLKRATAMLLIRPYDIRGQRCKSSLLVVRDHH